MTDDLIARLRDNIPTIYDCMDAADALEAKDKRIAELEEERQDSLNSYMLKIDETIELRARIAALEAALKPFAELVEYYDVERDDEPVWDRDFQVKIGWVRAAAAALKETGE